MSRTLALIVTAAIVVLSLGTLSAAAVASPVHGRSVSLSDAAIPPTYLRLVAVDRTATPPRAWSHDGYPCPHRAHFSDVSVYRWDGSPLDGSRFDRTDLRTFWHQPGMARGFRASYDGLTFYNGTSDKVLVAGWCE